MSINESAKEEKVNSSKKRDGKKCVTLFVEMDFNYWRTECNWLFTTRWVDGCNHLIQLLPEFCLQNWNLTWLTDEEEKTAKRKPQQLNVTCYIFFGSPSSKLTFPLDEHFHAFATATFVSAFNASLTELKVCKTRHLHVTCIDSLSVKLSLAHLFERKAEAAEKARRMTRDFLSEKKQNKKKRGLKSATSTNTKYFWL